jgi:hypothetical protein
MYKISIIGWDDRTEFDIDLTETEFKLIEKISIISKEESKTRNCKPRLIINKN